MPDLAQLSVHDFACITGGWRAKISERGRDSRGVTGRVPDLAAVDIYEALQAHTNAEDRYAPCEMADCIARDARVCVGVTGARGDDKGTYLVEGKGIGIDGIISDDGHVRTEEGELLIKVPSERIEIIDHQHVQGTSEMFGE